MAYVAQFERKIMLEHQRVGIAKAKSEGKFRGRPKNEKLLKRMEAEISAYDRSDPRSLTIKQIAEKLGISYVYVYRRMKQVAPEKIRHRTLKRDIIENVFDSDEESYSASREKKTEIRKIWEEWTKSRRDPSSITHYHITQFQENFHYLKNQSD